MFRNGESIGEVIIEGYGPSNRASNGQTSREGCKRDRARVARTSPRLLPSIPVQWDHGAVVLPASVQPTSAICFSRSHWAMIFRHSAIDQTYFFSMDEKYDAGPCFGHGAL